MIKHNYNKTNIINFKSLIKKIIIVNNSASIDQNKKLNKIRLEVPYMHQFPPYYKLFLCGWSLLK